MADIVKSGEIANEDELTDAELEKATGGTKDFHFTKVIDSASPTLFVVDSPAPPPPAPKKG